MATQSPSPSNSTPVSPPSSILTPPPQPSSTTSPPPSSNSSNPPVAQSNANPPSDSSTVATSPPSASPPPAAAATPPPPPVESPPPPEESPPPTTTSPPTQPVTSPPPSTNVPPPSQPVTSPPPPVINPPMSAPPPPGGSAPPPQSSPPPPDTAAPPPESPPPPPQSDAPTGSPPPSATPPKNPPPPSATPPKNSPPPPSATPPSVSPPSPPSTPPKSSPPLPEPPTSSPSPPASSTPPPASPQSPPSPPAADAPKSSPSPPVATPPQISSPPPANSSLISHPPPPVSNAPPSPSDSNGTSNTSSSGAPESAVVSGSNGLGTGGAVGIGVVVGVLVLGLIGIAVWCFYKRKDRTPQHNGGYIMPSSYTSSPQSGSHLIVKTDPGYQPVGSSSGSSTLTPSDQSGFIHSRSWFTYQELFDATNGFSVENLLGEGGFGPVYKGNLPDGKEVAIKQLKVGGGQGEREFQAEVEIISRVHHRHLVSLVGYCIHESRRLLVYDYVPNNTLHHHLHGEGVPLLVWANRIRIAAGAARGLAYLHEDCHPRIIHRDIKSSNILLDNYFNAQVADFGLARLALDMDTHISTRVMGTFGYLAPEYATSGKLTEKSDVYSYGVVLLELITGRKPVDSSQPLGDESLVEWARPLLSHVLETGDIERLVDPRLEKNYTETEVLVMIEAAAACIRHSALRRPKMGQVARAFDLLGSSSDLSNGMRIGASEIFNTSQQSADLRCFRRMAFGDQDYSIDFSNEYGRSSMFSGHEGRTSRFAPLPSRDFSNQRTQNANFLSQSNQNIDGSGRIAHITDSSDPISRSTDSSGEARLPVQGGQGGQDWSRTILE